MVWIFAKQEIRSTDNTNIGKEYWSNIRFIPTLLTAIRVMEEENFDETGKISNRVMKQVLIVFPTYEYLSTGNVLGKCLNFKESN